MCAHHPAIIPLFDSNIPIPFSYTPGVLSAIHFLQPPRAVQPWIRKHGVHGCRLFEALQPHLW